MSSDTGPLYDVDELVLDDFYGYDPSLALAVIALVLFLLASGVIALITERARQYRYMHIMTVTGLCEMGAFAAMVYAINNSGKTSIFNAYVAQQVLVVLSPNLIQATQYWTLGVIFRHSPDLTCGRKLLRGWVITTAFCCADLLAIVIQAIGISIWATSQSSGDPDQGQIHLGSAITLGGLALQLSFEVEFCIFTIWAHRHPNNALVGRPTTRKLYIGLYISIVCLLIRNIFRLVEFAQASVLDWPHPDGTFVISQDEVLFYTLDTVPILFGCFGAFILFHPSPLLPPPVYPHEAKPSQRQVAEDGNKALEAQESLQQFKVEAGKAAGARGGLPPV